MTTTRSTHPANAFGPNTGLALGLMGALGALLILNLALFDDLRVDPSAGVLETFTKPQHLSSLLAVLAAGVLLALHRRSAVRVAAVVAWIEIAAFTFFHLVPVEVGPSKPYWGDGMGDTLQWVGLVSILAVSVGIVAALRRRPSSSVGTLAASVSALSPRTLSPSAAATRRSSPTSRFDASRGPSPASSDLTAPARPPLCE